MVNIIIDKYALREIIENRLPYNNNTIELVDVIMKDVEPFEANRTKKGE